MTYGYRSNSGRFGKSNFRSPRGGRGSSFRGRGRGSSRGSGSDSYYSSSSSRDSFADSKSSSFRGSSFRGSSYRGRDSHYESRGSGNRYSGDRYSSSRGRRNDDSSIHHRDIRESASGSYGREHSRRSESESERRRNRSEMSSSFKEGFSPRRSYDEFEHSSRSYNNSNSSPYRSETSPFDGKPHKRGYDDFKKPLPPDRMSYSSRRPSRGIRGRGSTHSRITTSRVTTSRVIKTPAPSFLKRPTISRMRTTSRLQLILRKKKQLRIMRMRKEREDRLHSSSTGKSKVEIDSKFEDMEAEEEDDDFVDEEVAMDEDGEEELIPPGETPVKKEPRTSPTKVKKEPLDDSAESPSKSESTKFRETRSSPRRFYQRIALKCPHCKVECKTFKAYHLHLSMNKHKIAMEKLLYNLKQKLRRLRTEQREEQRVIDERDDNFSRTSYCKLCKLNFKQTRQEHMMSDFHVSMAEFLNSRCSICHMTFGTPILYENHRCTLAHLKRKAFLERKGILRDKERDDENNEDGNFMVLDSVGSADESNDEIDNSKEGDDAESPKKKTALEAEKKTTIIGSEFIKKVEIYYCQLCKLCLHYNPNRDLEQGLLNHCRTRFHLKRFSLEDAKAKKVEKKTPSNSENEPIEEKSADDKTAKKKVGDGEETEQFWVDDEVTAEDHKSSEDEDDSHSGNRYDRFSTSDEKDNAEKVLIEAEDDQNKKDDEKPQNGSSGNGS